MRQDVGHGRKTQPKLRGHWQGSAADAENTKAEGRPTLHPSEAHHHPTVPGTNGHVTPEFRLVGPAIVAVSSGESAAAVTAVADKIVSNLK